MGKISKEMFNNIEDTNFMVKSLEDIDLIVETILKDKNILELLKNLSY